jgi:hypothetical protein
MKRLYLLVACALALILTAPLAIFAAGCGDGDGPATALEDFTYAQAAKDCDRLVPLLDAQSKEILGKAIGPNGDPVEGCRQTMEAQTQTIEITDFNIIEENIDGDSATVKFSINGTVDGQETSEENTVDLVRENGEWKVRLFASSGQSSQQ